MVIKNKLLFVFILPTIVIGIVFSIATIASLHEEHKSYELFPGWNIISITRPMEDRSIADMSVDCSEQGKDISQAWIHKVGMDYSSENYIFVKGNVDYDDLSGYPGFIDTFPNEIVGQPLWLFLEGEVSCTLICGVDGCEGDPVVPEVECPIPEGCDCDLDEVEWIVDGSCGQGECDFGKVPAYKSCGEECPRTIGCIEPIEHPCPGIVPSFFIAHKDGSVSLIVDTAEDRFCEILVGSSYRNLDEADFRDTTPDVSRSCKNLNEEDNYQIFTLNERGNYATIPLTKRHQCKISNVAEGTKMRVACMDGEFENPFGFSIYFREDAGTFKKVDLEITEDLNIDETMKLEDIVSETSVEIGRTYLPELRITIIKGNGAVGREGGSDLNLIWKTDRNAACTTSDSLFEYTGGTPDSIVHTREVFGDDGSNIYILCRDEYDNHKYLKFRIDKTGPATIDDLAVTAEDGGNGKYKMTLIWRARGDLDSEIRQYDVRFAGGDDFPPSIHANNWYGQTKLEGETYGDPPDPIKDEIQIGDEVRYETESVFDPDVIYTFAVRAEDSAGNMGAVSENIKCLNDSMCVPRTEPFP